MKLINILEEAYSSNLIPNNSKQTYLQKFNNFKNSQNVRDQVNLFNKHWKSIVAGNVIGAGVGYEFAPEIGGAISDIDFNIPGTDYEIDLEDTGNGLAQNPVINAYVMSRIGHYVGSIGYLRDQAKLASKK